MCCLILTKLLHGRTDAVLHPPSPLLLYERFLASKHFITSRNLLYVSLLVKQCGCRFHSSSLEWIELLYVSIVVLKYLRDSLDDRKTITSPVCSTNKLRQRGRRYAFEPHLAKMSSNVVYQSESIHR